MISFITPTALPIEAATTMGVSVKEGGDSIGKFGTGLKYAIAGILRLGGTVCVWIDGERFEFKAVSSDIRGREFRIVHCNEQPCGFTTELGKHWEPWQLFRELASNALDEGGRWSAGNAPASTGRTVINVSCREVEESEHSEAVFMPGGAPLVKSSMGATIHAGPSQHYYYRGIRAGSFPGVAPVTVNVHTGDLSEDRLLPMSTAQSEMGRAFRSATDFDRDLMLQVLAQSEPGEFWIDNLPAYTVSSGLAANVLTFMAERPRWVKHPAFEKALRKHLRDGGTGLWAAIEMTAQHEAMLADAEDMCGSLAVDTIPREKVRFTRDLGDKEIAVTSMDTREVWFSTKAVLLGAHEFRCAYLEEALHAMTGFQDCTRELQNALLSMLVTNSRVAA